MQVTKRIAFTCFLVIQNISFALVVGTSSITSLLREKLFMMIDCVKLPPTSSLAFVLHLLILSHTVSHTHTWVMKPDPISSVDLDKEIRVKHHPGIWLATLILEGDDD